MFVVKGNCNQATVFSELRDEGAIRQIKEICSDEKNKYDNQIETIIITEL